MKKSKSANNLAKNEVIETEAMPEWIEIEGKEQEIEAETINTNDFTHIHVNIEGISVNGGELVQELDMNAFADGEIVVISHAAFVFPENALAELAEKLKTNTDFFAIGIAPHKMNQLAHDKATGIATYPSLSGAAVAFVAGGMETTLRTNGLSAFWHYLAFNKPKGKQSGYIRVEGIGWELNKLYTPKPESQCKTC